MNKNAGTGEGLGFVGMLLMGIGNFLPFATVSVFYASKSVNFIDGDGQIVLIAAIFALILMLIKAHLLSLLAVWAGGAITFYDMANSSRIVSDNTYNLGSVDFGIGCYMIIAGVIISTIALFKLSGDKNSKPKSETIKNDKEEIAEKKLNFCSKCGSQLSSNANFCGECGTKVE